MKRSDAKPWLEHSPFGHDGQRQLNILGIGRFAMRVEFDEPEQELALGCDGPRFLVPRPRGERRTVEIDNHTFTGPDVFAIAAIIFANPRDRWEHR